MTKKIQAADLKRLRKTLRLQFKDEVTIDEWLGLVCVTLKSGDGGLIMPEKVAKFLRFSKRAKAKKKGRG